MKSPQVKVFATQYDDLSLIPGFYMVEEWNPLSQVVLGPQQEYCDTRMCTYTHADTHTWNKQIAIF